MTRVLTNKIQLLNTDLVKYPYIHTGSTLVFEYVINKWCSFFRMCSSSFLILCRNIQQTRNFNIHCRIDRPNHGNRLLYREALMPMFIICLVTSASSFTMQVISPKLSLDLHQKILWCTPHKAISGNVLRIKQVILKYSPTLPINIFIKKFM